MAKATHKVVHPKLMLSVKGKLQKMPVGTPLALSDEQAKRLGKKVEAIEVIPTLEVGAGSAG